MKLSGFVLAAVAAMVPAVRGQLIEERFVEPAQRSLNSGRCSSADPEDCTRKRKRRWCG